LGELGRRGVVEPTRRVGDADPYRGGKTGSTDDEPTRKVRVVDPYPGEGVGDGRDVGSAARASDDVLDQELIRGASLVEAGAAAGAFRGSQFHTTSPLEIAQAASPPQRIAHQAGAADGNHVGRSGGIQCPRGVAGSGEIDDPFLGEETVEGCFAGSLGETPAHRHFAAPVRGHALARHGHCGK